MAQRLPVKSGQQVLKTFHRVHEIFNLTIRRMGKGDHVVVHNFNVPLKRELKKGLLLGIIDNAGMTKEQFLDHDP